MLFRRSDENAAGTVSGEDSAQAVLNSLVEVGLDRLVGSHTAFVNLSRELLVSPHVMALPRERVVFEILEDIDPDEEAVSAIKELHAAGYRLALDDFIYKDSLKRFLPYSFLVKLDVLQIDRATISENVKILRQHGVKLLAEKVESKSMFEFCKMQGFDYFQGYFFCKPEIMRGKSVPVNRLAILTLLARIQNPKISLTELEQIVSQDISLRYKLLRHINSASCALNKEVNSLRQALLLLGTQTVSGFASVLLMSGLTGKPQELTTVALVRAKMCELLARDLRKGDPDKFFTVGLLSLIDAVFDPPMEKALANLPLTSDIKGALLGEDKGSDLYIVLQATLEFERGDFDKVELAPKFEETITESYAHAVEWSRALMPNIAA